MLPISVLYWLVMTVRNWLFDKHVLPVTKLNVPVLSVGNIAAGGTGKTPLVEIVVRKLQARGRKPAIVSRGYGRTTRGYLLVSGEGTKIASPRDAGDEAVQMAENCAGSVVAVGENRVEAVKRVLSESSADCIVVDDGFQHRYLHRDLNIVLMTAKELIGGDWMLPAGNRRESMISIRRADAVIISKCRDRRDYEIAKDKLPASAPRAIAAFRVVPRSLRNVSTGQCIDRHSARGLAVTTCSGIGDPDSFTRSVQEFGCTVVSKIEFPDHHWYSASDLNRMRIEVAERKAGLLVTTQKDSVRLRALETPFEDFCKQVPVCVLEVVPEFVAGEEMIDGLIGKVLA